MNIGCGVLRFQDLNKRLSLPADIRIPDGYLEKLQLTSPPFDQPLSRRSRRASLVRICARVRVCATFTAPQRRGAACAACCHDNRPSREPEM